MHCIRLIDSVRN